MNTSSVIETTEIKMLQSICQHLEVITAMLAAGKEEEGRPVGCLRDSKWAAEYLGVKEQTLAAWRTRGDQGPRYLKVGNCVKYREADLAVYLKGREVAR